MTTKHTPGPWMIGYGEAVGIGEIYGVGIDTEPDWTPVCMLSLSEKVNEVDEANARLIAAAPDLLAALKDILCFVEIAAMGRDQIYWDVIDDCEGAKARAAIAKATGGTVRKSEVMK